MDDLSNAPNSVDDQILKAKADAEIAKANAEKAAAEQIIKDQKSKNRAKKISAIGKLSKTLKIVIAVAIIAVIIIAAATIPGIINAGKMGTTVSVASLKQAVSISKLSTAEFTYNGIAEKTDDNGNITYHIYYEATAKSGINMDAIDFEIDPESKVITVVLPPITVGNPVVDESKVDYLPSNANVNLREVLELCKADIQAELQNNPNIKATAEENLKSTLEALLLPIISDEGYSLNWNDQAMQEEDSNEVSE